MILLAACLTPAPEGLRLDTLPSGPGVTTYVMHDGAEDVTRTETRVAIEDAEHCRGRALEVWTDHGFSRTGSRTCTTEDSVGHYAFNDGLDWTFYATKTELRDELRVGETWAATHGNEGNRNERTCRAEKSPFCRDGLATACTTRWDKSMVWIRQHWCPEGGWRGMEARVWRDGSLSMTTWTTDVVVDGVALDNVAMSRRPFAVVD